MADVLQKQGSPSVPRIHRYTELQKRCTIFEKTWPTGCKCNNNMKKFNRVRIIRYIYTCVTLKSLIFLRLSHQHSNLTEMHIVLLYFLYSYKSVSSVASLVMNEFDGYFITHS